MTLLRDGKPTAAVGTQGSAALPSSFPCWHLPGGSSRLQITSEVNMWGTGKCYRWEVRNGDQLNPSNTTDAERTEAISSAWCNPPDTGDYDPEQQSDMKTVQRIRWYGGRFMLPTAARDTWEHQGFCDIFQQKHYTPLGPPPHFLNWRRITSPDVRDGLSAAVNGGNTTGNDVSYARIYNLIPRSSMWFDEPCDWKRVILFRDNYTGYVKYWVKRASSSTWTLVLDTSSSPHPTTYRWVGSGTRLFRDADNRFGFHRDYRYSQTFFYWSGGMCVADAEADVDAWFNVSSPPPAGDNFTPPTLTRDRRFGKPVVGSQRDTKYADSKFGTKYQTGLQAGEEGDIKDLAIWLKGLSGTADVDHLVLGVYADDGGGGEPGTKLGESDVVIAKAGNAAGDWHKVTPASAIRIAGQNVWLMVIAGGPTGTVDLGMDFVTAAGRHNADTYDASPPRMSDPAGAMSQSLGQLNVYADYDVVAGTPEPPADSTKPTLTLATIEAEQVRLVFSEPLDQTSVPPASAFLVIVAGSARTVSSVVFSAADEIRLTVGQTAKPGETCTISYYGTTILDLAGNQADPFGPSALSNETRVAPARSPGTRPVVPGGRPVVPGGRVAGLGGGGI